MGFEVDCPALNEPYHGAAYTSFIRTHAVTGGSEGYAIPLLQIVLCFGAQRLDI